MLQKLVCTANSKSRRIARGVTIDELTTGKSSHLCKSDTIILQTNRIGVDFNSGVITVNCQHRAASFQTITSEQGCKIGKSLFLGFASSATIKEHEVVTVSDSSLSSQCHHVFCKTVNTELLEGSAITDHQFISSSKGSLC